MLIDTANPIVDRLSSREPNMQIQRNRAKLHFFHQRLLIAANRGDHNSFSARVKQKNAGQSRNNGEFTGEMAYRRR